jgi:hypothetical protein
MLGFWTLSLTEGLNTQIQIEVPMYVTRILCVHILFESQLQHRFLWFFYSSYILRSGHYHFLPTFPIQTNDSGLRGPVLRIL